MNQSRLGTTNGHCLLQSTHSSGTNVWQNTFPACQLAFEKIPSSGNLHDDTFEISVAEDDPGWKGALALIVEFYVPTFVLLLDLWEAIVAFGVHSSG